MPPRVMDEGETVLLMLKSPCAGQLTEVDTVELVLLVAFVEVTEAEFEKLSELEHAVEAEPIVRVKLIVALLPALSVPRSQLTTPLNPPEGRATAQEPCVVLGVPIVTAPLLSAAIWSFTLTFVAAALPLF